jgi:D-alanine transaminase/branched-chain amino acid aminotransferase
MGVWLQKDVKEKDAADVLYHKQGIVSEFPRSNIFIVDKNETLITPAENVLPGITRKKLIEVAEKKVKVELRTVSLSEVKNAAEVFMTSTTKRLLPITAIDEAVIGNGTAGPVATLLNDAFLEMEEEYISSSVMK